ncbi:MAG: competence protein CoiA family protein [Sporolactobacillus sp.]
MLVALRQDGTQLVLVSPNRTREQLLAERAAGRFVCPVCRHFVQLKIGMKKQPHFAHYPRHCCVEQSEPETVQHLAGKADIYQWSNRHGYRAVLEHYLPQLRQRADVFLPGIEPVAFEYQCSSLSEELYNGRTAGYYRAGINPVWLLGGNRLRLRAERLFLSTFEFAAIRSRPSAGNTSSSFSSPFFLCYYDSDHKLFRFFTNLHACTKSTLISQEIVYRLEEICPHQLLYPPINDNIETFRTHWLMLKQKQRLACYRHVDDETGWLRNQAYKLHYSLSFYPAFCGLPHHQYLHFLNPPYLWQTWICYVLAQMPGRSITIPQIFRITERRHGQALFTERRLPLVPAQNRLSLVRIYLNQLTQLGVVVRTGDAYAYIGKSLQTVTSLQLLFKQDSYYFNRLIGKRDE